jgi:hypothetical protein
MISSFPSRFIVRTVTLDLEGALVLVCSFDVLEYAGEFSNPWLVLSLDDQHEAFYRSSPPLQLHFADLA